MSCGCTNSNLDCGNVSATPPSGVKISQLPSSQGLLSVDDIFVYVSSADEETRNTSYATIISFDNTVTSLSSDTFPEAITELDTDLSVHVNNYDIHYPMSAIEGITPVGGNAGQTLTKVTSADYDYEWSDAGIGDMLKSVYDTNDNGVVDNSERLDGNSSSYYATSANLDSHTSDTTIHFTKDSIDGLVVSGGDTNEVLTKNSNTDYDYSWSLPFGAGDTASRPVSPSLGFPYFDTDLGYQINYNGTDWVNSTGAIV